MNLEPFNLYNKEISNKFNSLITTVHRVKPLSKPLTNMDPKEFSNIKTFLSSPIKKKYLYTKQKNDARPTHSQTQKNRTQKHSTIFNRTFFMSMQNTQKGAINLKLTPKCKTQQSVIEQKDKNSNIKKTQNDDKNKEQSITRKNTQPKRNHSFVQGVKTRSLTFEYYYKKIKRSQNYERKGKTPELSERLSPNISKKYVTNLSQQMLQSMKKYIKKGEKVVEIHGKYSGETSPHYGLDIKSIEAKQPEYIDEELLNIKEMKKYSLSSMFVAKKPYRPAKNQAQAGQKTQNNPIKDRRVLILEKMLCKNKNTKTQTSPQKLQILAQKNDQKTIITRLQGMKINLNMILNSFKCIWVKQTKKSGEICKSPKKSEKYTYFIGYGNNKNLIRSIMKKRWWWTEVHIINEANFVWTQLKVSEILDRMERSYKQKEEMTLNASIPEESEQKSAGNEKSTLDTLSKAQISLRRKSKQLNSQYLDNLMRKENLQKLNWVFHEQTCVSSIQCQTLSPAVHLNFRVICPPQVVHNHFRLNYMFGNKNALFHNLKGYFDFIGDEERLAGFVPKTYYLQKGDKLGIREFQQKEFIQCLKDGKVKGIWIVKPAENSNRGQGISVHSSFESIRREIVSSKTSTKFIVQSYLRNLFLYQKRKFDIRTYLLMIKIGNATKYFWYHEGYIRTSSEIYNTTNIENVYIHLTNDAIQCDSRKYGKFEPGNKLSYSQFQRYLDSQFTKEKYDVEALNIKMKKIATEAVRAIHPKVKPQSVEYSFELFGLDFLIDSSFNPWLLQINTNPCLQLACPVLERLIPRMLENMFRLCLDPVFQPCQEVSKSASYFIYDNLFDINRFELVFDSYYDENRDYMEYCKKMKEKVYADDNDVFDNDGQEMDVEV